MSIEGQGHSLTLVKGHSDFKVKCLTFGLYTQVSDSGPLGPLVVLIILLNCVCVCVCSHKSVAFPLRQLAGTLYHLDFFSFPFVKIPAK